MLFRAVQTKIEPVISVWAGFEFPARYGSGQNDSDTEWISNCIHNPEAFQL